MKLLLIYHAACYDGSCSRWLFEKAYPGIECIPCNYGPEREELGSTLVQKASDYDKIFIADFSFRHEQLAEALLVRKNIVVLDHHKTAAEDLGVLVMQYPDNVFFDMNRSGAQMSYDYLLPRLQSAFADMSLVEQLVAYVQDADLWTWGLPKSRELAEVVRTYDHKDWDTIHQLYSTGKLLDEHIPINRLQRLLIDSCKSHAYPVRILKEDCDTGFDKLKLGNILPHYVIPCVNNTTHFTSAIVGELAQESEHGIAVGWFYRGSDGKYVHSLRSRGEIDVSKIAKIYGGGGHPNAAGFEVGGLLECVSPGIN